MNTNARKSIFKSVINNRNSYVYMWYLVASWACDVIVILTQKKLLCVGISVTSQAQLATNTSSFFYCKWHFLEILLYPSQIASRRRPDGGPTSGAAGATVGPTAAATVGPTLGWPSALGRPDVGPMAASRRWPDGCLPIIYFHWMRMAHIWLNYPNYNLF